MNGATHVTKHEMAVRNVRFIAGWFFHQSNGALKMKFRTKQFAYSMALAGLAFAAVSVAWAAADPSKGGYTIWYYSDASHTTAVGNLTLSCVSGQLILTGQTSAYPGPRLTYSCPSPIPGP
jgi:hypothetical protein